MTNRSLLMYLIAGSSSTKLQCYAGKKGWKYQECYKRDGFKTCFTKHENGRFDITIFDQIFRIKQYFFLIIYDITGVLVARGCATKRPLFHVECENHQSLEKSEEFCYCSYNLCNSHLATRLDMAIYILVIAVLAGPAAGWSL